MNSRTLNTDLKMKERGNFTTVEFTAEGCDEFLIRFRLMQWPLSMQFSRITDGGRASELGRREEEEGTKGEKRDGPSGLIYRGKSKMAGARIKEPEMAECVRLSPRFSG